MEFTGLRNLYSNFTSSISDSNQGKRFRTFLNSSDGRDYFKNNSKGEEGNTVRNEQV